ncbi:Retinol dehydrogenase 7 [Nibea albiflora]|uniref:Retinol dehydrogenase 7 n=1 Tax=Nibea albiflora TaxID=240163 RepID=A0ACB7EF68_NIBAL|nr:Retinol dehydrogenase 7 [Nibea albiflora]
MFMYISGLLALYFIYRWYKESKRVPDKENKYVYITGCDSGFGNVLARHLDQLGFYVIAGCYTEKGEDELKKIASGRLTTVHVDVTNSESVSKAAAFIKSVVGQKGLWAVVNNAGVSVPSGPTDWLTIDDFKGMISVNLLGVIDVTLSVLPLIKITKGRVVNVASVFGRISPFGGPYCVSKYGVESFNDSLRLDMAPFGVKVACIEPGFFKTNVTDAALVQDSVRKLWDKLPQDVKDDYGPNFIHSSLAKVEERFGLFTDGDLMKVINCMEHAISAVHPRTRYSPGWDAKLLWLPLSYMPTCIADIVFVLTTPRPHVALSHMVLTCALLLAALAVVHWYIRDSYKVDAFDKKHVFITGCDSGFGNLLARQLDGKGFRVIAACLTEKGAADLKAAASPGLKTLLLNVTDSSSIRRAVELVGKEVGERGLIDVTLKFLPLLKKAQGRVVNVASILGRLTLTGGGYCPSKYGVEAFSDSLRRDMQHFGIKVSIIEPGFFKTAVTRIDLINADLKRLWSRLSQDIKDSYGPTYFDDCE